jgi:pimeloyl-ACP methyl ester carboxylesterase
VTVLEARYQAFRKAHPARQVMIQGHSWAYREAGNSSAMDAVLLLPGALGRPETSFEYITAFAPHFRVIAPGYPPTMQTMTELADGVLELMERCQVREPHIIGGSYGGLVAQALLARHPQSVGRIVLSDTSLPSPTRVWRMRVSAALIRRLPERFTKGVIEFGVGSYVAALPKSARHFWQEHFREMLTGLTKREIEARASAWAEFDATLWPIVPPPAMLVLGAASDPSVSPRGFLAKFPHAQIHIVDSPLGHAASIGDADAYIKPILAFLTGKLNY